MRRLLLALGLAVVLLTAGPAAAAPPVTETNHAKNLTETFVDVLPTCAEGGSSYRVTTTSNLVEHVTSFEDGRVHATFTQAGKFVARPLAAGQPSYTGRFTVWGGFNVNGKTVNGTFTFSISGVGSDGSRLRLNSVEHFNQRPDGSVHEFFRCH